MKQCPTCDLELPDDAKFCGGCGHRFDGSIPTGAEPKPGETAPTSGDPQGAPAAETPGPSFALVPEDFERAFQEVCDELELAAPAVLPRDHQSLTEAIAEAGIDKLLVEKALHRISIEKLPEDTRKKLKIVLRDEVEPQGRPVWVLALGGVAAVGLFVAVLAVLMQEDPPARPPVELKPQTGQIDETQLATALDAFAAASQACYQEVLKDHPKLAGDVVVTLRVNLEGKVAEPTVASETLGDPNVTACILAAAKGQAYPAATIAPVDIDVPLSFAPGS